MSLHAASTRAQRAVSSSILTVTFLTVSRYQWLRESPNTVAQSDKLTDDPEDQRRPSPVAAQRYPATSPDLPQAYRTPAIGFDPEPPGPLGGPRPSLESWGALLGVIPDPAGHLLRWGPNRHSKPRQLASSARSSNMGISTPTRVPLANTSVPAGAHARLWRQPLRCAISKCRRGAVGFAAVGTPDLQLVIGGGGMFHGDGAAGIAKRFGTVLARRARGPTR